MIQFVLISFFYEAWRIRQKFGEYPSSLFVSTPSLMAVIPLAVSPEEEVFYSFQLFKKAYLKKEICLNKNKGKLYINWWDLRIYAKMSSDIPESEWTNLDLEF